MSPSKINRDKQNRTRPWTTFEHVTRRRSFQLTPISFSGALVEIHRQQTHPILAPIKRDIIINTSPPWVGIDSNINHGDVNKAKDEPAEEMQARVRLTVRISVSDSVQCMICRMAITERQSHASSTQMTLKAYGTVPRAIGNPPSYFSERNTEESASFIGWSRRAKRNDWLIEKQSAKQLMLSRFMGLFLKWVIAGAGYSVNFPLALGDGFKTTAACWRFRLKTETVVLSLVSSRTTLRYAWRHQRKTELALTIRIGFENKQFLFRILNYNRGRPDKHRIYPRHYFSRPSILQKLYPFSFA